MTLVINPNILRHYDIRGIYPTEINADLYYIFGQCFGSHIINQGGKTVCVGYDGRLSSVELETALIKGLCSTGVTVYRLGCGPSPLVYYADRKLNTDGALMITGSHNPKSYNGLKMIVNHQPFYGQMIQDFGAQARLGNFIEGAGTAEIHDFNQNYIDMLVYDFKEHYGNGHSNRRSLRVAWDPGNGAGGDILTKLIQYLPGQHFIINAAIDGTFPAHHPDPTEPENLQQLKELVLQHQCDIGIAFDGDADRLGVVDNTGSFMWGDQFLLLFAQEILQQHPQATILADVKTSQIFFNLINNWGGNPIMVATGHSNIKQKIIETGALLAGEMSGHVFFADRYYGYDDALYAAIRLLGIMTNLPSNLNDWRRTIAHESVSHSFKLDCTSEAKQRILDHIKRNLINDNVSFIDIDGIRVNTIDGWWLIRASNTQDFLVGVMEAPAQPQFMMLKQHMLNYLSHVGINDEDLI